MLASVEEDDMRRREPVRLNRLGRGREPARCRAGVRPAGRSPISLRLGDDRALRCRSRGVFGRHRLRDQREELRLERRQRRSGSSERRSTSTHTSLGIALIEVPPPATLALNVVFGAAGHLDLATAPAPRGPSHTSG